jgi:RNA polymerase sigma-70 factor (ECF subfamily)
VSRVGGASNHTDEELMAAYVAGDRGAFAALFERYAARLAGMFRRDLPAADADDLVQQTFLQLHRARRDFRVGAKLRPWLYTIALNIQRQHFRRAGRRTVASLDAPHQAEPAAAVGDPEASADDAQLRAALQRLPAGQRDVIVLHWFEGLSFREVAQVVGASQSAVKVRAHRGYAKLREILGADAVTDRAAQAYSTPEGTRAS